MRWTCFWGFMRSRRGREPRHRSGGVPGPTIRSAAADLTRDVAAQSQAVLDVAIGVLAEAHIGHPHDASALDLLGLTRRAGLGGRHGRDPGLAAGEEEVVDLDACLGPAVHRR